jgi:hypothetical protein
MTIFVPHNLDAVALAALLPRVGLPLPPAAAMLAGQGKSLSAAGVIFTLAQADNALAKHDLEPIQRMRIKAAMTDNRLLPR